MLIHPPLVLYYLDYGFSLMATLSPPFGTLSLFCAYEPQRRRNTGTGANPWAMWMEQERGWVCKRFVFPMVLCRWVYYNQEGATMCRITPRVCQNSILAHPLMANIYDSVSSYFPPPLCPPELRLRSRELSRMSCMKGMKISLLPR